MPPDHKLGLLVLRGLTWGFSSVLEWKFEQGVQASSLARRKPTNSSFSFQDVFQSCEIYEREA